jgi:hypothetical protein
MKKTITYIALLFISTQISFSQEGLKKTVILYNIVPLRVDLNKDGSVHTIYGQDHAFLKGYQVVRHAPLGSVIDTTNQGYYVATDKTYLIRFDLQNATLSQETITALDAAADLAQRDGHRILLTPYSIEGNASHDKITLKKNRINACLMYLDIKGITKSQIVISEDENKTSENGLLFSFLK